MSKFSMPYLMVLFLILYFSAAVMAQEGDAGESYIEKQTRTTLSIKPQFLPPSEILDLLGARYDYGKCFISWIDDYNEHMIDVHANDAANLIILSGYENDVAYVKSLIDAADVAPRQIEIQIEIVEINDTKAMDAGIDWQMLMDQSLLAYSFNYSDRRTETDNEYNGYQRYKLERKNIDVQARLNRAIRVLDEAGAANIHSAPKILTINNKCATILDGQRVTYVTRYSSFTNLFETDSMDAGLTMTVCPSVGESGYLTLQVSAEYTSLSGEISGSPVKEGQLIENTIIVKDGQSVLLGGLSRVVEEKKRLRFPLLGHILPFIFSREIRDYENVKSFMILTPRVVDLSPPSNMETAEPSVENEG